MWHDPLLSSLLHRHSLIAGAQHAHLAQQLPHAHLVRPNNNTRPSNSTPRYYLEPNQDQQSLAASFQTISLHQPPQTIWYFDSSVTNHMISEYGILIPCPPSFPSNTIVDNGNLLPVICTGTTTLPHQLHLNNILVSTLFEHALPLLIGHSPLTRI